MGDRMTHSHHDQVNPVTGARKVITYHCERCGDDMASKFQKTHDRICALREPLKRPAEWAAQKGIWIADPDGWRPPHAKSFEEHITEEEFDRRAASSTVDNHPREGR